MRVCSFHEPTELACHQSAWDQLAQGCVFRGWTWLRTWWKHYGDVHTRQFYVLAARDGDGGVAALLPAYIDRSLVRGRVLRLLGDGEVCSDHLGLMTTADKCAAAADAIADYLADQDDWDLLEFDAVDGGDDATRRLGKALSERGCMATELPGERCWAIDLPTNWEDFLALQSKSHRKQLRQLQRRVLDADGATWQLAETADQFESAWEILIDLHQRRRQSLGQPGCFASSRWAAFHGDVARRLLGEGRLRLSHLSLGGAPVAAEYHLAGTHATYAYQGGVDPERLAEEPGQLSTIRAIQRAIAEQHQRFDFLRGDEPYKAHWRAEPHQTFRLQAAAPRRWAQLRRQTWESAVNLGRLARHVTGIFN